MDSIFIWMARARIWNLTAELGIPLHELTKYFDTVSVCFSKGLGAPVGSCLIGSRQVIERAKEFRKLFGGGWRQAGYLANCCIYAIDHHWPRMKEDHANSRRLWEGLTKLGFEAKKPDTSIFFANSEKLGITWTEIKEEIKKIQEVEESPDHPRIVIDGGRYMMRLVTHLQTPTHGIDLFLALVKRVLENHQKK